MQEKEAKCVLGNGICPEECPNYPIARDITEKLGEAFDPFLARLAVVFGDAHIMGVNVTHVVKAMERCVAEQKTRKVIP